MDLINAILYIEAVDIVAEQMPCGNRNESPAQALFRNLNHILWQDLKEETEQALTEFQGNVDVYQSTMRYQIGKTVWNIIYGGFVNICIADDAKLFFNRYFTLISMVENNKCVGFNLVHFVEEDGGGILMLAGCEPVEEYMSYNSYGSNEYYLLWQENSTPYWQ